DVPRPLLVRSAGRLLLRPEPRAADLAHRAVLVAAGRVRFPEALVGAVRVRSRRPDIGPCRGGAGLRRRLAGAREKRRTSPQTVRRLDVMAEWVDKVFCED